MIEKMYAIYDEKAQAFMQPFFMPSEGIAVRAFTDCCNQEGHNFANHPEDYTLHEVGTWSGIDGKVTPQLRAVVSALAVRRTSTGIEEVSNDG